MSSEDFFFTPPWLNQKEFAVTLTSIIQSRDVGSLYSSYRGVAVNPAFYHVQETSTDLVITCLELDLMQNLVAPTKNLKIYADVVRVKQSISLPGMSITIHARQTIVVDGGATVDVSGPNTKGAEPNEKMPDGVAYGTPGGTSAAAGPAGGNAGNITIITEEIIGSLSLKADGGKGGRGIGGGNGAPGAPGADGSDGAKQIGDHPGQPGGRGGTGGVAGSGAGGGKGGNAGTIDVRLLRWPSQSPITLSALKGAGGDGGKRGQPGPGGPGGRGGINWICDLECTGAGPDGNFDGSLDFGKNIAVVGEEESINEGDSSLEDQIADKVELTRSLTADLILAQTAEAFGCHKDCWDKGRAPIGAPGLTGANGSDGNTGDLGSSLYYNSATSQMDYGRVVSQAMLEHVVSNASGSQLLMLLHRAELDYLSGGYQKCAIALSWLHRLLQTAVPPPPPLSAAEWIAMQSKVQAYITQLRMGLDFYGLPRNFVPLVSLDSYKSVVSILLDVADSVEGGFVDYWKAQHDVKAQLVALEKLLGTSKDALSRMEIEKGHLLDLSQATEATIASLTVSMSKQELVLREADEKFKKAVEDKLGGGCSFFQVLACIGTVIAAAAGAYPAAAGIISQVGSLAEKGLALKNVIETIKAVQKDVGELRKAFAQIAPLLAAKPDAAKIMVNREEFKEILKPYMDLPEAQAYKHDIELFLDLVDARNHKVLEYTAVQVCFVQLAAAIAQLEQEASRVETALAATQNPGLVEAVNFMVRLLTQAKSLVIRALYQEYRAYEYWALRELPFVVDDQDVARLRFTHGNLVAAELAAFDQRNRANQLFKGVRLTLTSADYPREFAEFKKTGRLVFTIPVSSPAFRPEWRVITLKEVKISVPGATTADKILSVSLIHSGRATFIDERGQSHEFTHRPRATNITYRLDDNTLITPIENNLGGDKGKYTDLSPFSIWTLLVAPEYNQSLRLDKVKKVEFEFAGFFLSKTERRFKLERHLELEDEVA
jgi:hypothetical protein